MATLHCVCCGSEVTAPQFFEGKVYGYTCIKKVSPQKRTKTEWVSVDTYEIKKINDSYALLSYTYDGKTFNQSVFGSLDKLLIVDGLLFIQKPESAEKQKAKLRKWGV
jgi:hypothetical protein